MRSPRSISSNLGRSMHRWQLTALFALALLVASPPSSLAQDEPTEEPAAEEPAAEEPAAEEPAAEAEPAPAEIPVEDLHNELRAFRAEMERALNERDLDAIADNVDEHVIFTPMNGEIVRGRDGVRAYYERMLTGPDAVVADIHTTFEADDLSILHDQQTAVAFGHSVGQYELTDGSEFEVEAVWVTTLLRRDGQWRIAAFSYSSSMFDNPILDMQRRYLLIGGGVAVVIMGLIMFFVGRMSRRKKAGSEGSKKE